VKIIAKYLAVAILFLKNAAVLAPVLSIVGIVFVCGIPVPCEADETTNEAKTVAVSPEVEETSRRRPKKSNVNFRGTETFIAEHVGDNGSFNEGIYGDDDNYSVFRNILYLQASNRHFDSALRLDATLFHNPPALVSNDQFVPGGSGYTTLDYGNDFRVERMHGTAHLKNFHVTVGDFYVNFGRGLALSLIKLDDVGVDNALRGARVEYHKPRSVKLLLVGGVVNALNTDPLTHQIQKDDPLDRIAGARVEWELLDALVLGAHGVFMTPRFTEESEIDSGRLYVDQSPGIGVMTGGASTELHLGGLHIYAEGNGQSHDNYRPTGQNNDDVENESGVAVFAEISYDLAPFNIKGEGIFYKRWLMEGPLRGTTSNIALTQPLTYHHMVTLEPVWMVIRSFGNVVGGRLTGDLYLKDSDTQFTLATAVLDYQGGLMPQGEWSDHPTTAIHPTLKIRQGFGETGISLFLGGGYRYETTSEPEISGEDSGHLWHATGDLSIPVKGPHSIETKVEVRRHMLTITEGLEYWVTLASLGYDWSGKFGLTGIYEYSDQTQGAEGKIGEWTLPLPRQHYFWAMGSVHFPKPLDRLTLRLLGGSQRGGVKCAGGICRTYPDAVGAKLEAVYRF
jgi:uncharacterized protein DUF6029